MNQPQKSPFEVAADEAVSWASSLRPHDLAETHGCSELDAQVAVALLLNSAFQLAMEAIKVKARG